ncbi:outer membrane protein assembly factor BamA [Methylocaldum szegediense]|uniref:Outer membrane protein assembly factor BamA n=1 Tax=Methylocaldum szegediense TaxID=73780 RepID=A0ABM9I704_9GAMM|nr:outer membrane protein assembly factor BamA [Methylocaldum szegediense]CAI8933161.1 Outer membrane protein assembly factor BamA [Methylocaldum szegediense]
MSRYIQAKSLLLGIFCSFSAWGLEPFVIEDIRVEGLQRVSAGTVFNYLPVKVGDLFDDRQSAESIKALFKTGFFRDVRLEQDGNVLVVIVDERPSIASVKIEGNKDISTEDLTKALKGVGLSEGKVFDRQILDKVEQELRRQYYSRGKYGLKIDSSVTELPRNRVSINIKISEGKVAKIKQINIVGNNVFSDEELLDQFELSTPNLLSFYTKDDQYSKQKLSADLERLRSYYLDRGYINFEIESTQVSITPDKKEIYITINVKEGEVYTVNEVKLTGKLIVPPEELTPLVKIGPSDIFSRKLATETSKAISDRLGDEGYIFANVNMVPDINEAQKTVAITFFVDPGKQVYVRRINFQGNTKTRDEVLRREMRQMEAAWASTSKIERSKTRLERLGYFQEVNVETPAVAGTTDQIDVNYSVVEKPSGNLMAGVGFSQAQGIIFNASITQDNVFGTGKRINLTFNNSSVNTIYRIGYFNPYTTLDGISSGFDLSYRNTDASRMYIARYNTDVASAGANLGIPLNEFDSLRFNVDFEHTKLDAASRSSQEILDFIQENGNKYNTLSLSAGWVHDTLNRAIFPTKGGAQRISVLASLPFSDLTYYKASYKIQHYFPIAKDLTFMIEGEIAYGDGYGNTRDLPFFEHYFAGGPQSVRGFQPNTLGPRTRPNSQGFGGNDPFGGSSKLVGTAELFFPVPFIQDSKNLRLGTFIDAGNVFDGTYDLGEIRYSAGLSARWLSPFGALAFSVAQPINARGRDEIQNFQFSFGSGF